MEGKIVCQKDEYIVIYVNGEFIIYNTEKEWEGGHTHLKHIDICRTLIKLACYKKLPRSKNGYLMESICRISSDEDYIRKVRDLMETRLNKGSKPRCRKRNGFEK